MSYGVTISQAAAFAGVTVKAVRHYHKVGLIPEPERDSSGYRRYGPNELLRLVQVNTLANAGLSLAEVGRLLDVDDADFALALVGVEQRLTAQIDELIARRDVLHRLATGDRALLPDRAVALLERMPALGFSTQEVAASREGLILARALVPERFDEHIASVEHAMQDPEFIALIRRGAESAAWAADDPRIPVLAEEMAAHLLAHPAHLKVVTGLQARSDTAARYRVVRDFGWEHGSAAERAVALIEARLRATDVRIPRAQSD